MLILKFPNQNISFYSYIDKKELFYEDIPKKIALFQKWYSKLFAIIDAIKETAEKDKVFYL